MFDAEDNLFLLPGPVKLHPRITRSMMVPAIAHRSPEFRTVIRGMTDGLRTLFQSKKAAVAAMSCSATGAMEAALGALIQRGDRVVVPHNGKFGQRFLTLAQRVAGDGAIGVASPMGQPVDVAGIRAALAHGGAKAVAMVINESSTAVKNPVAEVAELCKEYDALLIADGVTAFGGMDVPMDKLGIDVAVCGSQKAIGAPAGLAFVAVDPDLVEGLGSAGTYLDLKAHVAKWRQETTPFTPATHLFLAAAEALRMLQAEGVEARAQRNRRLGSAFRTAMATMGLELLAAPGHESPTLTAVKYPPGVGDAEIRDRLRQEWGIVVAGGQEPLNGKIFRAAHMGFVSARELAACVVAVEECLARAARTPPTGAAAAAFAREAMGE